GREEFEGYADVAGQRSEQRSVVRGQFLMPGVEAGIHWLSAFLAVVSGRRIMGAAVPLSLRPVQSFTVSGRPGSAITRSQAKPASDSAARICSSEKPSLAWAWAARS